MNYLRNIFYPFVSLAHCVELGENMRLSTVMGMMIFTLFGVL